MKTQAQINTELKEISNIFNNSNSQDKSLLSLKANALCNLLVREYKVGNLTIKSEYLSESDLESAIEKFKYYDKYVSAINDFKQFKRVLEVNKKIIKDLGNLGVKEIIVSNFQEMYSETLTNLTVTFEFEKTEQNITIISDYMDCYDWEEAFSIVSRFRLFSTDINKLDKALSAVREMGVKVIIQNYGTEIEKIINI